MKNSNCTKESGIPEEHISEQSEASGDKSNIQNQSGSSNAAVKKQNNKKYCENAKKKNGIFFYQFYCYVPDVLESRKVPIISTATATL